MADGVCSVYIQLGHYFRQFLQRDKCMASVVRPDEKIFEVE
jgi:hypothetical protein